MRVEEEYVKTGYFWLPGREENKIPGILTIKDGGNIELEVVGQFEENIKDLKNNENNLSRIIGYVEKDGLVTLDNCSYLKKNDIQFVESISKSKVSVQRVFSGIAYDKDEKVTFNSLSFSVDCMDEWVGISGINIQIDKNNLATTINYQLPENIIYSLDNGMQLELCFSYTLDQFSNKTEARIIQKSYFKLSSEVLKPLAEFIDVIHKLTNFMCFAIDETVTIKNLIARSNKIEKEIKEDNPYPISIYYQSIPYTEEVSKKSWHQMLFHYGTIRTNTQNIINNWLNAYSILSPAFSLYFSTKIGAQKYLDGKFLALAQGLETYHRRTSNEKLMSEEEFKLLVDDVKKNCPIEKIDWLESRLMHGNEINLGKRLKKIIDPFKEYLGTSKERSKLLRKIVDTRNYLTHYNEELKSKSAEGEELWILCQKMEVIFQLHFLKVLGFNDNEIKNVVKNCYPLKSKINDI